MKPLGSSGRAAARPYHIGSGRDALPRVRGDRNEEWQGLHEPAVRVEGLPRRSFSKSGPAPQMAPDLLSMI
jgi:hypothetical protein